MFSAAVLAGGSSRRMGTDKALIEIDGEPLVVRIVRRLEAMSDDVFVVAKRPIDGVRTVLDDDEDQAPLVGIAAALRHARHPRVFVCGCDMPSIDPLLAADLASRSDGTRPVIGMCDGAVQPLHSVWTTSMLGAVDDAVSRGRLSARRVLEAHDHSVRVPVDTVSAADVDTPADVGGTIAPWVTR